MPKKAKPQKSNGEPNVLQSKDKRPAPDSVLLNLLQKHNLAIVADEVSMGVNVIPDTVYTVDKRIRIRVYYKDQLPKSEEKPKVDIAT